MDFTASVRIRFLQMGCADGALLFQPGLKIRSGTIQNKKAAPLLICIQNGDYFIGNSHEPLPSSMMNLRRCLALRKLCNRAKSVRE
jgi:hypothetical protein